MPLMDSNFRFSLRRYFLYSFVLLRYIVPRRLHAFNHVDRRRAMDAGVLSCRGGEKKESTVTEVKEGWLS